MHCFCCDHELPTDPSDMLDEMTGRYYCIVCGNEIQDLYREMYPPDPKKDVQDEYPTLDELPSEETWENFNIPVDDYYEESN